MALTNEDRKEIKKMIAEEMKKLLPDFLGRSLVQLRKFFISNI